MENNKKKSTKVEKPIRKTQENKGSIYKEFLNKVGHLSNIKIKKIDDMEEQNIGDISDVVDNLSKCGLIVKKVPDYSSENSNSSEQALSKENIPSNHDEYDELDDSDYEIETLDEDESDLEYVPELKKLRDGKRDKKDVKEPLEASPKKKPRQFMKIISTNYMCVMCQEKFASLDLLTAHMRSPTPCKILIVKCPLCGKEFPNKSRCSAHMYTHKEKEKFSCDKCTKQFSTQISLQMHSEFSHTEHFDSTENGWKCKMCEYVSESRMTCVHHVNSRHLHISAMLCDICGKSFVRESSLRTHMMTHTEIRSYACQICEKSFKMKSSLKAHIKTHNLERRFVCDECGRAFKKNCSLTEHKKYHAGDFSHTCLVCEKRFVSKSLLNTHMKNHSA